MYSLARALLFRFDPDRAHDIGQWIFRRRTLWRILGRFYGTGNQRLSTKLNRLTLTSPVGLAAGFDKNGELTASVSSLGFGFITVGSVTYPSPGNPRPWMCRDTNSEALVNSMGLPSKGPQYVLSKLSDLETPATIVVSIAGKDDSEFLNVFSEIEEVADAIEVNVSCPNIKENKEYDSDPELLKRLLDKLPSLEKKPMFVKIPHYEESERDLMLRIVDTCTKAGFTGITAGNTKKIREPRLGSGYGGLSGKPLLVETLRSVKEIYGRTDGKLDIIATGGIFSGKDAFDAISCGASAVGILTSLVFRGPSVVRNINRQLAGLLEEKGFESVAELRGYRNA